MGQSGRGQTRDTQDKARREITKVKTRLPPRTLKIPFMPKRGTAEIKGNMKTRGAQVTINNCLYVKNSQHNKLRKKMRKTAIDK